MKKIFVATATTAGAVTLAYKLETRRRRLANAKTVFPGAFK